MIGNRTSVMLAAVLIAVAAPAIAQQTDADIERIRTTLDKLPPTITLNLEQREPDFRVHIQERRPPLADMFDIPSWMPEKPGWQPPPIYGINLMSLVGYVARELADAKRGHDVRAAKDEVRREIARYCAAQPGGGAGIQICAGVPAAR